MYFCYNLLYFCYFVFIKSDVVQAISIVFQVVEVFGVVKNLELFFEFFIACKHLFL